MRTIKAGIPRCQREMREIIMLGSQDIKVKMWIINAGLPICQGKNENDYKAGLPSCQGENEEDCAHNLASWQHTRKNIINGPGSLGHC